MKLRIALMVVMSLTPALLLVGCSDSNSTGTAPDTTPPLAPVIQGARASDGVVGVWWGAGSEPDLNGYYIYMTQNGIVTRMNRAPILENRFTSSVDVSGSVSVYVTAVDYTGNESSPSASSVVRLDDDRIEGISDGIPKVNDASF